MRYTGYAASGIGYGGRTAGRARARDCRQTATRKEGHISTAKKHAAKVRRWREEDIPAIVKCHKASYPNYPPEALYGARMYKKQLAAFPEGQLLAEADGRVVGYATSLIAQLDEESQWYSYGEITGAGTFSTHNPAGDTLYGADIAVHPDYRGKGISGLLYQHRKKLLKRYNLRRMVAHGRIPGYKARAAEMSAEEYVKEVRRGRIDDPSLKAHLKTGYRVKGVILGFMKDEECLDYVTLLEMLNPDFSRSRRRIAAAPMRRPARKIRVGAAQFLMRPIASWDEFERNVEFFVMTADEYKCHFLLLPELFTAQLFSTMPSDLGSRAAIRNLSGMTDRYIEMFTRMSARHGLYIIGGTHPVARGDSIYNVAHLFTPTGKVYTQDKLHVTPTERREWNIRPGSGISIFDTPLGRIAVQICYDIEFPEVSRLLALAGVEVIFVPFSTDEKKAYWRVRCTAQARAVENFVYVVLSGNVGNLPAVRAYLINYGQAAVYTPSDFPFPLEATAAEAEPNVETIVITDLDLSSLAQHRDVATVRPLYDRRRDLYELTAREPIRVVRTE